MQSNIRSCILLPLYKTTARREGREKLEKEGTESHSSSPVVVERGGIHKQQNMCATNSEQEKKKNRMMMMKGWLNWNLKNRKVIVKQGKQGKKSKPTTTTTKKKNYFQKSLIFFLSLTHYNYPSSIYPLLISILIKFTNCIGITF